MRSSNCSLFIINGFISMKIDRSANAKQSVILCAVLDKTHPEENLLTISIGPFHF
jgi:hypothetical protein